MSRFKQTCEITFIKICSQGNGYYKEGSVAFYLTSKSLITISIVCQHHLAILMVDSYMHIYTVGCNDDQNELIVASLPLDCKVATMYIATLQSSSKLATINSFWSLLHPTVYAYACCYNVAAFFARYSQSCRVVALHS